MPNTALHETRKDGAPPNAAIMISFNRKLSSERRQSRNLGKIGLPSSALGNFPQATQESLPVLIGGFQSQFSENHGLLIVMFPITKRAQKMGAGILIRYYFLLSSFRFISIISIRLEKSLSRWRSFSTFYTHRLLVIASRFIARVRKSLSSKKSPVFGSSAKLRGRAHCGNKPSVFKLWTLYNTASLIAQYFIIIA